MAENPITASKLINAHISEMMKSAFMVRSRLDSMARDKSEKGVCFPETWIAPYERCRATSE